MKSHPPTHLVCAMPVHSAVQVPKTLRITALNCHYNINIRYNFCHMTRIQRVQAKRHTERKSQWNIRETC